MSETPINGPYLTEMCGDDVEFEKELIDSYPDASPALLATTRSGVISGDADAVRTSAPTLIGKLAGDRWPLCSYCK
jgi:hypothetical protein